MKNAIIEPPGRHYQTQLFPYLHEIPVTQPKPLSETRLLRYASIEQMVELTRPAEPVHAFRPKAIMATARWFLKHFPGDVMYAVKTNPDARVLSWLQQAGIRHFDAVSLAEVEQVAALENAQIHFMHPVKPREAIAKAYFMHGVRDFSLDSHEELQKILEVTGHAIVNGTRNITADTDLRLSKFFRLSEGYFLRLQNTYDMMEARRTIGTQVAKIHPITREAPNYRVDG